MFKIVPGGELPTKGSKNSACIDLRAREDIVIAAGETKLVPLGIMIDKRKFSSMYCKDNNASSYLRSSVEDWVKSHYLQLMPRSSLSLKTGLIIANGVGIIDMDYEGEIGIVLHNPIKVTEISVDYKTSKVKSVGISEVQTIKKGDRIAQITLLEHKANLFGIDTEDERIGGFGSTDKKWTNLQILFKNYWHYSKVSVRLG